MTNEKLTAIYNKANGISEGKRPPITTERVFTAMREMAARPPDVLFDGFAVLQSLDSKAKVRTSAENVSDVLDAVVRFMRSNVGRNRPDAPFAAGPVDGSVRPLDTETGNE